MAELPGLKALAPGFWAWSSRMLHWKVRLVRGGDHHGILPRPVLVYTGNPYTSLGRKWQCVRVTARRPTCMQVSQKHLLASALTGFGGSALGELACKLCRCAAKPSPAQPNHQPPAGQPDQPHENMIGLDLNESVIIRCVLRLREVRPRRHFGASDLLWLCCDLLNAAALVAWTGAVLLTVTVVGPAYFKPLEVRRVGEHMCWRADERVPY